MLRQLVTDTVRLGLDVRSWPGLKALRAPSLVIAVFSCCLGIALAYRYGKGDLINDPIAVLLDGLLLQAGVNLVNDFFEFRQGRVEDKVANLGLSPRDREFPRGAYFSRRGRALRRWPA